MAADVAQRKSSRIKRCASAFSNILICDSFSLLSLSLSFSVSLVQSFFSLFLLSLMLLSLLFTRETHGHEHHHQNHPWPNPLREATESHHQGYRKPLHTSHGFALSLSLSLSLSLILLHLWCGLISPWNMG